MAAGSMAPARIFPPASASVGTRLAFCECRAIAAALRSGLAVDPKINANQRTSDSNGKGSGRIHDIPSAHVRVLIAYGGHVLLIDDCIRAWHQQYQCN